MKFQCVKWFNNFLLYLVIILGSEAYALSDIDSLFAKGNDHFLAGDIHQAKDVYLSIVHEGISNDKVFFNLANCYLKTGDIGRAVYYYRCARQINFRDHDIRANLSIARRIVDETGTLYASEGIYDRLVEFVGYIGAFGLSLITAVLWLSCVIFFIISETARKRAIRRRMVRVSIGLFFMFMTSVFFLGVLVHYTEFVTHAVAIDESVIARNGPGEHFTGIFEQQPGFEMVIKRKSNGWLEVTLPNGFTGWVPASSVKIL